MALVTPADLKTYMDISLTNRQMDAAVIVLAGLQSEMEMYLRRPIESASYTEIQTQPEILFTIVKLKIQPIFNHQQLST